MMTTLQILFWLSLFLVFYTHLGYGILLYMLVKLKELFVKPVRRQLPGQETAGRDTLHHSL